MKPVAIIQARIGSTRLPGKVLKDLAAGSVLDYVVRRCRLSKGLGDVLIATTDQPGDDPIEDFARMRGIGVFRGSQEDVLLRYVKAARLAQADPIVRITSDCPLVDPDIIDRVIEEYRRRSADYLFIQGYPRGVGDVELMTLSALETTLQCTTPADTGYREHVMTYLTDHPERFRLSLMDAPERLRRDVRLCVDEPADLEVVRTICSNFAPRIDFRLAEILAFLDEHPEVSSLNCHVGQKSV